MTYNNTTDEPAAVFAISDQDITRIAHTRAGLCNGYARELGQPERVQASALIDLYFQSGGRCAMCTAVLTKDRIQLDHIKECNYRSARAAKMAGKTSENGKLACIDNLQWVCVFCNQFKERCRRAGVDLNSYVRDVSLQSQNGFPIRARCKHLGTGGSRAFRESIIQNELRKGSPVTASVICQMLAGTPGEASYPCVVQHMKELGWQSTALKHELTIKRRQAVREAFEQGKVFASTADLTEELNLRGGCRISYQAWRSHIQAVGIKFAFEKQNSWRTQASSGDKQTVLAVLRELGPRGLDVASISARCRDRGMNDVLTEAAISRLSSECAVYSRDGGATYVAALTRKEAASLIGVSWIRLKKWGAEAYSHLNAGPPYMKASPKALAYYRHEDVEAFLRSRERTQYDLVGAGGTHEGGKLGGRPQSVCL